MNSWQADGLTRFDSFRLERGSEERVTAALAGNCTPSRNDANSPEDTCTGLSEYEAVPPIPQHHKLAKTASTSLDAAT